MEPWHVGLSIFVLVGAIAVFREHVALAYERYFTRVMSCRPLSSMRRES